MDQPQTDDDRARAYYDDFSKRYEKDRHRGYHALIDDLEVAVAEPLARDARILELGCGTGLILQRLAPIAREAIGVDLSPGMAAKAQARGLDVRVGSVTELPFDDNYFDLAYSFKVLAHVPDIRAAVAEATRVVRPGGHLLLEFYNPWSMRYLAKRIAGPQSISTSRTEADVHTRWDSPRDIEKLLPTNAQLIDYAGVRVFTPAAFMHRVPLIAPLLRQLETASVKSPLRYFGGFLIAKLQKR